MRIGIDVGGSHIGVGLVDDFGKIIIKKEKNLLQENINKQTEVTNNKIQKTHNQIEKLNLKEDIINNLKKYIAEIITEKKEYDISMIGIAYPARLHKGERGEAVNLPVSGVDIKEAIEKQFNIPTYIRNDAKCAAISEKLYGSLKEYKNAVFLTLGTGIGGAVFLQNQLLTSGDNDIFEVGHMVIQKNGIQCKCGKRGCFERYASISALKTNVKHAYNIEQEITGKELHSFITANLNDEKMQKVLNEYIENLSIGISNIINLFEPEAISIGGSFAHYEDIFLEKLKKQLKQNTISFNDSTPKIMLATSKNDAGIIGATRIWQNKET